MKILLYHPWIYSKGGAERLILELVKNSKHDIDIITHFYDKDNTFPEFKDLNIRQIGKTKNMDGFLKRGLLFALKIMLTKIKLKKYDAFLVSNAGIGELITLRNNKIKTISYTHTLLRVAHSFYGYYANDLTKKLIFAMPVRIYRYLEKKAWKNFNLILTNSNNIKDKITRSRLTNKEIKVLYPGVDTKKYTKGKKGDYILVPGRIKEYKRIELAIKAYNRLNNKDYRLIIAGSVNKNDQYFKKIKRMSINPNIKILTNVDEDRLVNLYKNCFCVLFAAKDEDFGIVPLEAMACAKPILSVDEGGPIETIIHNKTGFLTYNFEKKLNLLIKNKNLYNKISKNARLHALTYDWKFFGKRFDEMIK